MHKLHSHLDAADKAVRFRAAQALAAVLQSLPEGGCIDEALAQQLAEGLRDRLRDKSADVRQCAARAMGRLPAADEVRGHQDSCIEEERAGAWCVMLGAILGNGW